MAYTLDPMDIKQIIRLHLDGLSNRRIGTTLGISRNTINRYIQLLKATDKPLSVLAELDNGILQEQFPSLTTIENERYESLMVFFDQMRQTRHHPGFTFQHHYQEYQVSHEKAYSYTQFMEHYRRKYPKEKGSMKLDHAPGHELFIDFAGKKLHIFDKSTGEQIEVEVFVSILPNSQYTYVEACYSQKREDLIKCMGNALKFYGGVPLAIVCDNLKSAVQRASKYEAQINRTLKEFALHHDCVINPTRTYSPQDKALVENAVNLAYQRIYYPLREMTFFSLEDLNRTIRLLLDRYNDLLFQRKDSSRKELFQSIERCCLKPLPSSPYQLKEYRRAKVQKMGYIYFSPDKNYYSVPYRFIGKQTQIHYTSSVVEIYYNHERIAIHGRSKARGSYITEKDHLSSAHQAYSQWSPDYFERLADKHGQYVTSFIKALLADQQYPEVNYKRAMGIIQLAKSYGSERLDKACQRALEYQSHSYQVVRNMLENGLENDQINLFSQSDQSHIPEHENIRGSSSYQ